MHVGKDFWKLSVACILSVIIQNDFLSAMNARGRSERASKKSSGAQQRKSAAQSSGRNVESGKSEENHENDNYPFTLAAGKVAADEVAGIRIKNGKIVLLSYEYTYSLDNLPTDCDFSDLHFFKQYPKLISVEINGMSLTGEMLENLQKFLPATLKGLLLRSCNI
ncbi:MAG: hypothetical protein LBO73_03015, partial [Holosporaceae bacterium]|nr:hypothetical protein [Holosporaceae bacterium]